MTSLDLVADRVAERAVDPAVRDVLLGCTPTGPTDAACFRSFVVHVGRRLLRRPLDAMEVDAYVALLDLAAERGDFDVAVQLALRAMLQSPSFVYRVEVGEAIDSDPMLRSLDDFEIASRLSFLVWGSGPDDALLDAAEAGLLRTDEGLRLHAERMLADPRARARITRFHAMWLGWERATPTLPPGLGPSLERESAALIERVIFDERASWLDVFLAPVTYVDAPLAEHYGLPAPPPGESHWVRYPDADRAGILSHGAFLSVGALVGDTSPIRRGRLVRQQLLCERIPSPAEIGLVIMVDTDSPPGDPNEQCKWDRYAVHRDNGLCAGCHDLIEPVGFGLEAFDTLGRRRFYDVVPATGEDNLMCPVRAEGRITGVGDEEFSGPAELGQLLAESDRLDACAVRQYFRFAIGRHEDLGDEHAIMQLVATFRRTGHRFDELVLGLVTMPAFRYRVLGAR